MVHGMMHFRLLRSLSRPIDVYSELKDMGLAEQLNDNEYVLTIDKKYVAQCFGDEYGLTLSDDKLEALSKVKLAWNDEEKSMALGFDDYPFDCVNSYLEDIMQKKYRSCYTEVFYRDDNDKCTGVVYLQRGHEVTPKGNFLDFRIDVPTAAIEYHEGEPVAKVSFRFGEAGEHNIVDIPKQSIYVNPHNPEQSMIYSSRYSSVKYENIDKNTKGSMVLWDVYNKSNAYDASVKHKSALAMKEAKDKSVNRELPVVDFESTVPSGSEFGN